MDNTIYWVFPDNISFEEVPTYVDKFSKLDADKDLTFDLSKTESMHSSFIGYLLHVQNTMRNRDRTLDLILSLTVVKTLIMLNIINYFSSFSINTIEKKTA